MSQYTKQNALHKIKGYHILRPGESDCDQAAFDRAKAETIENLSEDLQAVRDIQFGDFIDSYGDRTRCWTRSADGALLLSPFH